MLDRRIWRNFDFKIFIVLILISLVGFMAIYCATLSGENPYFTKQIQWFFISMIALLFVVSIDYSILSNWSNYIYGLNILLLLAVFFLGSSGGGSQRWLDLGFMNFQPSESAKIIIVITLAEMLSRRKSLSSFPELIVPALHVGIPMILIFLQPDLGTSLTFIVIFLAMVFVVGFPWKKLLAAAVVGGTGGILALWPFLDNYQKLRLISFVNPQADPTGSGYQVIQSMVAIGSGGPTGRGLLETATQSQLRFLPAQHTDFIFAVLGEKMGFIWSVLLLALYCYLLYRIIVTAMNSKDSFGTLICVGVAAILFFQIVINIGMNLGIMPVTGLTLPFVSYGGSSLLFNSVAMGLVLNVGMRREKIQF